jgi:hypothetical protein
MQPKSKNRFVVTLLFVALSSLLFSFSTPMGGDSFEIYVNNKLVLQQYVTQMKSVQNLNWSQSNVNDEVTIYYSHCGKTGKNRSITIRDAQNKILKKWQFADAGESNKFMSCKMKDILGLQKSGNSLYIYYSSNELPHGRLLATVGKSAKA